VNLLLGLAAALVLAATPEAEYRADLDLLYDGSNGTALARLQERAHAPGAEPLSGYVETLALAWTLEQRPASTTLDEELVRRCEEVIAQATARLEADPTDARARFARGGTWGVLSRYHMFRLHRTDAARAAVKGREDLMAIPAGAFGAQDALFGLGLYDYYADVLPRVVKILRFLARMPAGNRVRGLARVEEATRTATLHQSEAVAQLYEIYAFYEKQPDKALAHISTLRKRYPGSPLWALKLAEHQRERLGLYAESVATGRGILAALDRGEPNYAGPELRALAHLAVAEGLLGDGRAEQAEAEIALVPKAMATAPWAVHRLALVRGRIRELLGDARGAAGAYTLAAASPDDVLRERAEKAGERVMDDTQRMSFKLACEARALRHQGLLPEAAAKYAAAHAGWPELAEAEVGVLERDVRAEVLSDRVRERLTALRDDAGASPPWVPAWASLILAELDARQGLRAAALASLRALQAAPVGQDWLKKEAARRAGLLAVVPGPAPSPSPSPRKGSSRRRPSPAPSPRP
jgi:hypothetical protein